MKWTTKENVTKDIRELETNHLENILKMLIRNNGKEKCVGGGVDADDIWFDCELIDNTDKIGKVELELRFRKLEK